MEREGVLNMTQDYISYIRSKVGHDKIILTFAGGILTDKTDVMIYEFKALNDFDISDFHNVETLRLRFFSGDEIMKLESVSCKHRLMLEEYFTNNFAMGH